MKRHSYSLLFTLFLFALLPLFSAHADAADLDEIVRYAVTVDVNEDATLHMVYHIDWKVLDSTSDGPLTWVQIGIPNSHCSDIRGLSPAVKKAAYSSSGGNYVRVDLDRAYQAGEIAEIEFELTQDYMYQVNKFTEGETVYDFTPGWFEDIRVDELMIRWKSDRALAQTPDCLQNDGYYQWTSSLGKGERFSITVTYSNDAFGFDLSKSSAPEEDPFDIVFIIIGFIAFLFVVVAPIISFLLMVAAFFHTSNFSSGDKKKITRTKVVYYPECQGCGAPRPEGKDNCEFCGRSFIKSEEVIKEEDIPEEEKALRSKNKDGIYRYTSQPNTYVRVHVTHIPVPRSSSSSSSSRGGRSFSCAHSSCACACACACAGGGRAGCSVKDFYNTGLKLRQLAARGQRVK